MTATALTLTLITSLVTLHDGAARREVVRLEGSMTHRAALLRPVLWRDAASLGEAVAWVGRRALVTLEDDAGDPAALLRALALRPVRALSASRGLWLVESLRSDEDGLDVAARVQRSTRFGRGVKEALPDLWVEHVALSSQPEPTPVRPNDPRYPGQWYLDRLAIENAWALSRGSAATTVVVVDNGCDMTHPDLVDKLDPGYDAVDDDEDPSPAPAETGNNHGTACAGLVGATTNNAVGIAGTCPECRVRCVRLLGDAGGLVPISADVAAFEFARDQGAAVVSNSWGFREALPVPAPLAEIIDDLHRNGRGGLGTVIAFAAGNEDRILGDDELPSLPAVLNVGAVNNFGEVAQFSNGGASLDVVAPLGTLSTDISGEDGDDPGDYTSSFGGTSSACPVVAGVAGLIASAAPEAPASEIERALRETARQSPFATPDAAGHDLYYGFGLIQPASAIALLAPPAPVPVEKPASGCAFGPSSRSAPSIAIALAMIAILAAAPRRGRGARP